MSERPNLIFILTDDQGFWALGASGNREIHTPNLDRLAATGVRFTHMLCASPVCSPARATLLTGQMPSQHGVLDWLRGGNYDPHAAAQAGYAQVDPAETAIPYLNGRVTYPALLAQAGYTCGLSGKWHLGDSLRPAPGFSFWRVLSGGGSAYFNGEIFQEGQVRPAPGYLTDAIAANALAFLDWQTARRQPFFLAVHPNAPHSPWDADQHPPELRGLYRDCPFESVPDLPVHPNQINSAPRGTGARRRELLTGYYAAVSGVDRLVGRILAWLDAHNQRENTLLIFTSDNGMNMGHHGLWGKGNATYPANMYEESVRVPFIVSQPGRVPAGVVDDSLLSHYDIFPTLLDLFDLPNPSAADLPGRSFAPLLRGAARPAPNADERPIYVYDEYGPTRMARTRRWKYVHRYPNGPHELYDLQADPGETHNRVDDPAARPVIHELRASLADWFARYSEPANDGALQPVTGMGQLRRPGAPSAFAAGWHYVDANGEQRE